MGIMESMELTEEAKGELIVCEGIDGSGKTSHSKKLAEFLGAQWRRFPNRDTPIGKILGDHLSRKWQCVYRADNPNPTIDGVDVDENIYTFDHDLDSMVFQALQVANRVECAEDFRLTLLKSHIVCDRYWPSGYGYGGADGLDKKYMIDLHKGLMQPSLFVLFDVDVEEAFARMAARDAGRERYEGNRDFLNKVASNYRELWRLHSGDPAWVRIDANGTVEQTWAQLKALVEPRIHPLPIG